MEVEEGGICFSTDPWQVYLPGMTGLELVYLPGMTGLELEISLQSLLPGNNNQSY